jgi:hypothetical protein
VGVSWLGLVLGQEERSLKPQTAVEARKSPIREPIKVLVAEAIKKYCSPGMPIGEPGSVVVAAMGLCLSNGTTYARSEPESVWNAFAVLANSG